MSIRAEATRLRRVMSDNAAWALLRSNNAWFSLPLLATHLGGEQRRLPAAELFERIDADLEELRAAGIADERGESAAGSASGSVAEPVVDDMDEEEDGPTFRTAQYYCKQWRDEGILVRRTQEGTREETYELAPAAFTALRFLDGLDSDRTSLTQSRLSTVQEQLRRVVRDTDPNVETRIAALEEQKARIEAQIKAVRSGTEPMMEARRALESVADLVDLTVELPSDFARVRAELEDINRSLRTQLVEEPSSRGLVLAEVFNGVDHLESSDAGQSFEGFYELLLDTESAEEFVDNLTTLLSRDFARDLGPTTRAYLRSLFSGLHERSAEVSEVMTSLTRSLRRFVQSEDFREERAVHREITQARALALKLAPHVQPFAEIDYTLHRSSVPIRPITRLTLDNPGSEVVTEEYVAHESATVDIAALREMARLTDIDFAELTHNVNVCLADSSTVTLAEVLDRFPATQGVASVVGLLDLVQEHGEAGAASTSVGSDAEASAGSEEPAVHVEPGTSPEAVDSVVWTSVSGVEHRAKLPRFTFTRRIPAGRTALLGSGA